MWRLGISLIKQVDWLLVISLAALAGAGLLTMRSFTGDNYFFTRQLIWLGLGFGLFFAAGRIDFRFLRRSGLLVLFYLVLAAILGGLLLFGETIKGARGWIDFGVFSFQPADFMKLSLILLLAKYFSRRHIEIAHVRHILISAFYAIVPASLILLQPDFGSAAVIMVLWLGLITVSGVSKKHLLIVLAVGAAALGLLWFSVFTANQQDRIITFLNPLADIRGAGYSAFQSTIAVGSGQLFGKGVGFGTQSRLNFLPEYETDFVFAAFAEEWGLVGVIIYFALFGLVIWRIMQTASRSATNFETLYGLGLALFFMSHFIINVGMNIGLLPVTGLTLPFTSYGGSHLLAEFIGLGILQGMRRYSLAVHRDELENEFLGGV
ncbi:MAG: rod shape-determining protein RodA [Candidatus Vogelbacteria bacterium]|nr:rod shape-determining protein RodA [Candidatus Vogelbacteria bacterium]